jgi:DNA-binding LytR/AlgR family response regulator
MAAPANTGVIDTAIHNQRIAVLDFSMPGRSGVELIKEIKRRHPGRPVLVLSMLSEEAHAAQHWSDLGTVYTNWADALLRVSQLDRAQETFIKAAEAEHRGGTPRINIVLNELGALGVDVMQNRADAALPAIEAKLSEVRAWWISRKHGEPVPEAPVDELLERRSA